MSNFYADVLQKDPRFLSTTRISDLNLLEPVMRTAIQAVISDAKTHGMDLMVFETYRSQARQKMLFDQGASKLLKVGVHHYGLACDLVKDVGGSPSWKGDFSILRVLGKSHGLIWGGDWGSPGVHHSFVDSDHLQRCSLKDQVGLFAGTWYPADGYNPYA